MQAVGERGRCRLVDQALHLQASEGAGAASGLALLVVEISWNGDDSLGHRGSEMGLGICLQPPQHQRRELLGQEGASGKFGAPRRAHVALEGGHGAVRMGGLALARLQAGENLPVRVDADSRGRQKLAKAVRDHVHRPIAPHRAGAIGGPEIDADDHDARPPRPPMAHVCVNGRRPFISFSGTRARIQVGSPCPERSGAISVRRCAPCEAAQAWPSGGVEWP